MTKSRKLSQLFSDHRNLLITLAAAFLPFLSIRMIRTTGDEKVYIAQAFEMAASHNWFVQILGGVPDYYKGPLHYILLRFGILIFGNSLWTAIYMNFLFIAAGSVALAEIVRLTFPQKKHWPYWAGIFLAFNAGVYGHFFASQMEVELAGIFSVAMYFLWRDRGRPQDVKYEFIFWILAGFAGWLKSPLHSFLAGVSAVVFWAMTGQLFKKMKSPLSWIAAVVGVLTCIAGFMPAYIFDGKNFVFKYIMKENNKSPNGGPWWESLLPIVSYYLVPWLMLMVVSYAEAIVRLFTQRRLFSLKSAEEKRLFHLAFSFFVPTTAFFCVHFYHGENYTVPIVASVPLFALLFLKDTKSLRPRNWVLGLSSFPLLVLPVALQWAAIRFHMPQEGSGWPVWLVPGVWIFSLLAVGLQLWEHFGLRTDGLGLRATLGNVCMMTAVGVVLAGFGEMEVYPLKERLRQDRAQGETYNVYYWNLNRLIWNEWGLMRLSVHDDILPLLSEEDLKNAITHGDLILARDTECGDQIQAWAKKLYPHLKGVTYPWPRWKTHAADGNGHSLIGVAWEKRDLSILFDHALILRFFSN